MEALWRARCVCVAQGTVLLRFSLGLSTTGPRQTCGAWGGECVRSTSCSLPLPQHSIAHSTRSQLWVAGWFMFKLPSRVYAV